MSHKCNGTERNATERYFVCGEWREHMNICYAYIHTYIYTEKFMNSLFRCVCFSQASVERNKHIIAHTVQKVKTVHINNYIFCMYSGLKQVNKKYIRHLHCRYKFGLFKLSVAKNSYSIQLVFFVFSLLKRVFSLQYFFFHKKTTNNFDKKK